MIFPGAVQVSGIRSIVIAGFSALVLLTVAAAPATAAHPGTNSGLIAWQGENASNVRDVVVQASTGPSTACGSLGCGATTTGDNSTPAWSPAGDAFVFSSTRDGNAEIYRQNITSTGPNATDIQLGSLIKLTDTATPTANTNPTWSPNGSTVAFASTRDGNAEIYTTGAGALGSATRLTNDPATDDEPSYSPDSTNGGTIAFSSDRTNGFKIYTLRASDGANQTQLLPNFNPSQKSPDYSPNGDKLLFSTGSVYVVQLDDATTVDNDTFASSVTDSPSSYSRSDPAFSPDGTKIAYASRATFSSKSTIRVMPAGGGASSNVAASAILDYTRPYWQPKPGTQSAPLASVSTATKLTSNAANLNGNITAGGAATSYHFDYGVDQGASTSYTSRPTRSALSGYGARTIKERLPKGTLAPNTTYRFRVVATNSKGSVTSATSTFTTRVLGGTSTDYSHALTWGGQGNADGQFYYPAGIGTDASGNVYVADTNNKRIEKFDASGNFMAKWGSDGSGNGQFVLPVGVAVDPNSGNVYVVDSEGPSVQKFTSSGGFIAKWPLAATHPVGITVDGSGNVYVVERDSQKVDKFNSSGALITSWGTQGTADGQFQTLWGVDTDSAGNVYTVDGQNGIQKFSSSGTFIARWGDDFGITEGKLDNPRAVAVDSNDRVLVADRGNHRIQRFSSNGTFQVAFGWGVSDTTPELQNCTSLCLAGTGGAASGQLSEPTALAVSGSHVYTNKVFYSQIQRFDYNGSTPPQTPPAVTTDAATGVGQTGVTLNGHVNPNGASTGYHFEYGLDQGGSTVYTSRPSGSAGSGNSSQAVSDVLPAGTLAAATTYRFRLVATNSGGTTTGGSQTLTTNPASTGSGTPIFGTRLHLGDSVTTAARRKISLKATDNALRTFSGSPTTDGATVRVKGGGFDNTYTLPAGANWTVRSTAGGTHYYRYNDSGRVNGPISSLRVYQSSGKLMLNGKGSALGHSLTNNPGAVDVVVKFGSAAVCTHFGGTVRYSAGRSFTASKAAAPASCPA